MGVWRARRTSCRHNTFPVFRSSASVTSLSPSLAVRKTRSAVTTGDDRPNGTAAFQARFLLAPNCAGKVEPSATPVPFGPRNCSQSFVAVAGECFVFCPYAGKAATRRLAKATMQQSMASLVAECGLDDLGSFIFLVSQGKVNWVVA